MIIAMKRVTLVAHRADEAEILRALQAISAVQVISSGEDAEAASERLVGADSDVERLRNALATMRPFAPKKGLMDALPETSVAAISATVPEALREADSISEIARELAEAGAVIDKNSALIDALRPWESFPEDMQSYQRSSAAQFFTGIVAAADAARLDELADIAVYQIFSSGSSQACVVACAKEDAKTVAGFLKSLDWTDYAFPKLSGTPKEAMARLSEEIGQMNARRQALEAELGRSSAKNGDLIAGAFDAASITRERAYAASELGRTAATFVLEGWVPEDRQEDVEKAVSSVTDAYVLTFRDPNEDEVEPSYVENNAFSTPFEAVTNLYSRPDPKGIDATPYMAPFYVLLFGLMLSDTGYGLILALGCWLFTKLKKPTGMTGALAKVLFWGGLSTVVWGVLVGTFFGLDFDVLFGTNNVFPLLVDPMDDPIGMLILCFGLGILHILFGVALKMKMAFEAGDWQTAIFDNLSWIMIVLGLIVFAGPKVLTAIPQAVGTVGLIVTVAGALMILLFKGRESRNPFKRTISGLGELYQVTSYLSDILSYARLFALGIATGVIASVFNDLCGMLMGSPNIVLKILGVAIACVLLVALHLFNIGINTLGAFVHCARLQYVEFYGKFYEAGGKPFTPLGYRTKHVRLTDN